MAQRTLEVQELAGQDRNSVRGQSGGRPLTPWRVFNLVPHRAGGYAPYGRRVRLAVNGVNVALTHITRLLGYDEIGIASFATESQNNNSPQKLSLFKGSTAYEGVRVLNDAHQFVHMDTAGGYRDRDSFFVLDRDDHRIEPIDVTVGAEVSLATPYATTKFDGIGDFVDVAYGNGIFMAVTTGGAVYSSEDGGNNWSELLPDIGVTGIHSIAFGGDTWLISSTTGIIMRSTDDGVTWGSVLVTAVANQIFALTHEAGLIWWLGGKGDGGTTNGIRKSTDGGLTWTVSTGMVFNRGMVGEVLTVQKVAILPDRTVIVGVPSESPSEASMTNLPVTLSLNNGATWNIYDVGPGRLSSKGHEWTVAGPQRFYSWSRTTGQVRQSADPVGFAGTVPEASWQPVVTTLSGTPKRGGFDLDNEQLFVVGTASGAPRVWRAGTDASLLARVTALETAVAAAGATSVNAVAFDDNGLAVFVCDNGVIANAPTLSGLTAGTYNLYSVSYLNTRAGRLVFDLTKTVLTINEAEGAGIRLYASRKTTVGVDNAWLAISPDKAAILDQLRMDVYVQYEAERGDSTNPADDSFTTAIAETTIRYAFTVPYPDGADGETTSDLGRRIGELPIGRQLVVNGAPTTSVFEPSRTLVGDAVRSRTALHNGRLWGLAAQDESLWNSADGISLEIANQSNAFVLCYSEIGWANLMSDQSFIPIQPTQSANFVGMMSTPSGLMLLFDNEILLVTGDPAFGNVTVDLYLDMVGADVGSVPCKLGGLPFTVWDGKIWALQAGQAQEVSTTQWLADDPFVRITPEPQTRSLLALTEAGVVFRLIVDDSFWLTDPVNRNNTPILEMLPAAVPESGSAVGHTRFARSDGSVYVVRTDGVPDAPHLVYRDVDFGEPERRTPVYTLKATFEGTLISDRTYDRSDINWEGGDNTPAVLYETANSTDGRTHSSIDPVATGGIPAVLAEHGGRSVGTLTFRFPLRETRSHSIDLRLELRNMRMHDAMKLPVRIAYAAGGETK